MHTLRTRPKLVIFDCDGVLVDSETITNRLLRDDLALRGLHLQLDDIMRLFVGGTMAGVAEKAADMGADIPPDWVAEFYPKMHAALANGTPLIDGVDTVIDRLDTAGIPYAVGSNGSLKKMSITLGQHPGIEARLKDRLYSAHALGVAKPDPGLFLAAAQDFGIDPADCAVIDDSPTGCIAARRAGMRCFGFAEHDDGARLAAEGAEVFHAMSDLPDRLGL
ncbi:MAG: HAD-IA family hydrolase [Rhodobacter sp.]|nr:HAD-IA family hydrolase [Rhodobacter sp.]